MDAVKDDKARNEMAIEMLANRDGDIGQEDGDVKLLAIVIYIIENQFSIVWPSLKQDLYKLIKNGLKPRTENYILINFVKLEEACCFIMRIGINGM